MKGFQAFWARRRGVGRWKGEGERGMGLTSGRAAARREERETRSVKIAGNWLRAIILRNIRDGEVEHGLFLAMWGNQKSEFQNF